MDADAITCPTCRANQVWSDACRRCKSDLRLLREAYDEVAALRRHCLSHLHRNRPGAALEQARKCLALRDDAANRRLLAVCELLNGHWASARSRALQMLAESGADFET